MRSSSDERRQLQYLLNLRDINLNFKIILKNILSGRLKQRGLGLDQVEFFLDKSSTPIPYNADVSCLVGQKIIVRGMQSFIDLTPF